MYHLVYVGKLPRMNRQMPSYWLRYGLQRRCLKQFGMLPRRETRKARVSIVRVLGPRERLMDEWENFRVAFKGGIDSLVTGGYLVDDSPRWVSFSEPRQDATRRHLGPRIEIDITYELEPMSNPHS